MSLTPLSRYQPPPYRPKVLVVVAIGVAVRLTLAPPTAFVHCVFVGLDFLVPLGLYIEYINNLGRAESYTTTPYLGPGFFLALGATALLIAATVVGWRERDEWQATVEIHGSRSRQ